MTQSGTRHHAFHKLGLVVCLALAARRASAASASGDAPAHGEARERLGAPHQWVFSAEDLIGLTYHENPDAKLYYPKPDGTTGQASYTGHAWSLGVLHPTVGADFFVLPHLSVGLGASYDQFSTTSSTTSRPATTVPYATRGAQTMQNFSLGPRVGLAYTAPSGFGVWGRAALTTRLSWGHFVVQSSDPTLSSDQSSSSGALIARFSAALTYSPAPHFVLTLGPSLTKVITTWSDPSNAMLGAPDEPILWGIDAGAGVFL